MPLEEELESEILRHAMMEEETISIRRLRGEYPLLDNTLHVFEETQSEGIEEVVEIA